MFHPLSVLDHVPSAVALEIDADTLDSVLAFDGDMWAGNEACYNGAAPDAPMLLACSVVLDVHV